MSFDERLEHPGVEIVRSPTVNDHFGLKPSPRESYPSGEGRLAGMNWRCEGM